MLFLAGIATMARINLLLNVEQLAVGVLSVIALLVIETQSQVTDLYIGSIDNVVLPEDGSPVMVTCPVLTSVDRVNWFMYDNDTFVNVSSGINYAISTIGRYYCQATEQRGVYRSNTFTVYRVGFADSFSLNPMSLSVHRTTTRFAFECEIEVFARDESDFNRTRIEWEGASSSTPDLYQIQDNQNMFSPLSGYSILVIDTNGVLIDMFPDRYRCRAVFTLQNGSEVTAATSEPGLLIIDGEGSAYDGDLFLLSPSNKTITEMDRAAFACVPADSMFQPTWLTSFPSFITGPNNYYLLVDNVEQTLPISCSINDTIASSTLTVQEIPIIISTLPNTTLVREGTSLTLQCQILMTTPTPTIVWLANGVTVQVSTENYTITVGSNSEGIYQCLVEASFIVSTNSVGLPPTYSFISTTFVDTYCVPNITVVVNGDPSVSDIMFGNSFNITCQPSCPTVSVTWRRDNAIISNSSSTAVTIDGFSVVYLMDSNGLVARSVLSSSMAVLNDSATYHCISTVQGIETTDNITIFVYARATIIGAPEDLAVALGENATFTCVASGRRTPDVSWFQINNNGLTLIDSESEIVLENGTISSTLLIRNVVAIDFGNYFCMASNEFSIARANFTLSQAEVPSAPVSIQLIENGSRTANISWQDGVSSNSGNPPTDSYQVVLLNNSRVDTFNVPTTSIFFDPLLPFTNYTITIAARNRIGVSNNSEPFSFVTNEEPPGGAPQNLDADSLALGTINISWTPPPTELQYGIIIGYRIYYNIAGTNDIISNFTVDLNITLIGLLNDTEYQITVTAENGAGISSVNASVTTSTIAPPINIDNLMLPNGTVPSDRINPNSIIVELPSTNQSFSHAWVAAIRLSSVDSPVLSVDTNEVYPTENSFESYTTAVDDEPYIVAEISQANFPMLFPLGDNSSSFAISDFPGIYINGPLTEGRVYSVFVRYFSPRPQATRTKRIVNGERQYDVFTSTSFFPPVSTADTISFNQSVYDADEENELIRIVLILTNPLPNNTMVQVISSNINATENDYVSGPYNVTILAGETLGLLDITIINDNIVEETEIFNLVINALSLPERVFAGNPNNTVVNILDSDVAVIRFNQTVYNINEDTGVVQPTLFLSKLLLTDVTVNINSTNINATGVDYNPGPYFVTIPAGMTNISFNISINPDNILEGDEVFLLAIDQISLQTVIISDDSAIVVITDDDSIMLNFSQSLYVVDEDDGVVLLELILSNPSSSNFTVSIITNNITASRGSDYDPGPYNLIIPAGNTSLLFTVPLAIDSIVELEEEFELRIDRTTLAVLISTDPTRVVIMDNDTATVNFVQSTYSVNETDESVEVEMILSDPSSTNLTVQVTSSDIIATGDVDYDAGLYSVMFSAGEIRVSFNISITDDNILEVTEEFNLTIISNSLPTRIFNGSIKQTTVFIIDNDDIVVNFSRAMYNAMEGNGIAEPELIFSNPSSFDITVQVMATDNTAAGVNNTECATLSPDNDYTMGLYNVTFPANVTTRSVDIPVCDDRVFKGDESFSVSIISNSSPDNVNSGSLSQATVIIIDDDLITISFNQMLYRVNESDGTVEIMVGLSNPSMTDITVQLVSNGITAMNGTDFFFLPLNITFLAGSITNASSIRIRDDDLFEIDETFDLNIILSSSTPLSTANRTTTVVIMDDDPVEVNFSQPVYSVEENSGVVEIQLIFSNPSSIDITVEVNSEEINATGGFDYDPGPYSILFSAGETFRSFNISIFDNNTYEAFESFNLIISPPGFVLFGNPRQTITTISDEDDVVIINFDQPAYSVDENNGPAQSMLILSNPSVFDITLQIVSNGLSGDYISGPYEVIFFGGRTNYVLNITIVDDNLLEPVERFNLTIESLFGDATIGNLDNTVISIFDNDAITVRFIQPLYIVAEESRIAQPELIFSNPSYTDINVTILNMEIDATENVDYNYPGPFNVTVPAGDTRVVFTISITSDSENEGTENFNVTISSANLHPNVSIGNVGTTVVSIVDDIALIRFAQSSYSINENIGTLQVEVTVSEPFNVDIAVHIVTSDISTTGADYRCNACNRTLMAGTSSVLFDIIISDDNILELDEEFMLSNISTFIPSSSSIRVIMGSPESTAVVIEDNDFVFVNFSQLTYNASEGSEMAEVDIRFSNPSSTAITVQVTNRDISANSREQNNDYSPGPYTITFLPGRMNNLLNIPINDDDVLEEIETFNLTLRVINSLILSRVSTGNVNQVTVAILDNDPITVSFEQSAYSVNEELIMVQPVLIFSNPSQSDITVQVMNTDVSTSGSDYNGGPYNVIFLARRTRAVLTISVTNDNILEVNESFSLGVDSVTLPNNVASTNQTIITITDNDTLTINFSHETYFVNENNVSVQARLILSDPSSRNITVQIDTFDNNATGGLDYASGPHNVVVPAGETEVTFSVVIHNDTILERTESFTLSMNSTFFETNRILIGNANSTLVLINDTSGPLTVEFSSDRFEGVESSMQIPITLSLGRGTSAFDITITIMLSDQSPVSAEGNEIDYDSKPINATFPTGATSSTINVSAILDSILEQREMFQLTFTIPTSIQDVVIAGRQTTAIGVIIDTTNATISFTQSVHTIVEDNTILQIALNMSNVATFDVNAQINSIENGSAIGNVDYISRPVSVTFSAGDTTVSFNVSTIIDNTLEVNETYILVVAIDPISLINSSVSIITSNTTVIIIDDDPINVTFSQSAYTTTEDDGFLPFVLLFTNPSAFEISITVETSDITAMGNADFDAGPHIVGFAINTTMVSFNISITVENILEIDENFMFRIDPAMLIPQVFLGNISQAGGLIIDDDPITVSFGNPMYITREEYEQARLNMIFSNPSSFDITIQVMATDNTAAGVNNTECATLSPNNDYTMGLYNVTFNTSMTESFINISVCNDIVLEENETFSLMIVSNSLHANVTSGNPSQVEVTIMDNDPITVTFNQSIFQANESNGTLNGRADVIAVLSNPSYTTTTVQVQSNDITATSQIDFTFAPRNITFPVGETSYTVVVEINDDDIFELGNETFGLSLTSVLFPQSLPVTIANGITTVLILDDDPIKVNFSLPAYNVDENSQNLPITLIFSNPSSTAITVGVNSSPQTVTRDFDYDPGPYTAVFPALTTTASFDIRIFDNHTFEASETFNLTIDPPSFVFQGDPSQVTATILDHRDIVLERPFQSVILLEGTRITLSCFPTLFPEEVPLNWTNNDIRINEDTNGITFSPRGLNHNLTIEAPTAADSGIYRCIAAPTVNQSINVTVLETCEADFTGALLWPTSQRSRLVTQRCSALHPSFRSGVTISRQCGDRGDWSPVSIQDCTMFDNSNPLVIVYLTVNTTEVDLTSTVADALSGIQRIQLNIMEMTSRNVSISESDLVGFAISFTLRDITAPTDIINTVRRALPRLDPGSNFGVLAFQPSGSCLCDVTTNTNIDNGLLTVCTGPSTPPCNSNNMCNVPTFVGNGSLCGLDTDTDGFPDVQLDCSVEQSSCEQDLCPEIYSVTADGTQSGSFCNRFVATTGCQAEVDSIWSISWPVTESGDTAIQKCPGGSEAIGLTTRRCISDDNWADPDVSNCSTVEQVRLADQAAEIQLIANNILSTSNRDLTVMYDPQVVVDIAGELGNITNTTLVPNDTSTTADTLGIIVNVARNTTDLIDPILVLEVIEGATTVVDNLLDARNDISFQDGSVETENRTVGERVLGSTEDVALLLVSTLDSNENGTMSRNITRDNIIISAQRPTMNTIQAIAFPPPEVQPMNITAPSIEISEDAVRFIFNEQGGNLAVVSFLAVNFNRRLPTDEGDNIASAVISSQTSSADSRTRVPLGNNTITLRANLTMAINETTGNPRCAFWDFTRNNQSGGFSEEGIMISSRTNEMIECVSNHLTSFAILVNTQTRSTSESTALSIVSYIGCGISIVCIIITIIVFIIFRKKIFNHRQHFIHLNLVVALLIGLILFVSAIETASDSRAACLTVAILLHYFFMATFCWMLCEGILLLLLLYFVFYKGFFKSWKFFIIIGWGIPIPIVAISAGISHEHYGSNGRCWISNTDGAIWGFIGPMLLIILINAILLTATIIKVFKSKNSQITAERRSVLNAATASAKAAIILLPVFGLTWVFGLLAINEDTVVFAWIFTVINSLQGLFILVFYVLKNKKFKKMIKGCISDGSASTTASSTYKTGTLQTRSAGRRFTGSDNPSRPIEQPRTLQRRNLDTSLDTSLGYRNDSAGTAERNDSAERQASHRLSHIVFDFDELPAQREEIDN